MKTDRFNSNEDIEFHEYAYSQGRESRWLKHDMKSQNPYDPILDSWLYQSFCAGWAERDMELMYEESTDGKH